jgi:histidyl-tRNA synthetase
MATIMRRCAAAVPGAPLARSGGCRRCGCPPPIVSGVQPSAPRRGFKTVRGMRDVFPPESRRLAYLRSQAVRSAELAGYAPISTPLLEDVGVFTHALGDASDVVSKEMYTLEDRRGAKLCLRPENTAGVARAFGASPLAQPHELPQRLHYHGPMFRYERPQRGRYRQFEQFGVERFDHVDAGTEAGVVRDAEVVGIAAHFLRSVGVLHAVELQLNFLGDSAARARYSAAMAEFLAPRRAELSAASQERLDRGSVLRILDSKSAADAAVLEEAPLLADFLSPEAAARAAAAHAAIVAVVAELDASHGGGGPQAEGGGGGGASSSSSSSSMRVTVNPRLVRGLDYYTDTVFEFVSVGGGGDSSGGGGGKVGAQSTVLAGGSYGGLVASLLEGKQKKAAAHVTGVGWSAGLDRLSLLLEEAAPELCRQVDASPRHVAVLPMDRPPQPPAGSETDGEKEEEDADGLDAATLSLRISQRLRSADLAAVGYGGNGALQKRLGRAVASGASHAVFIPHAAETADKEDLESVALGVKDLSAGTQVDVRGVTALLKALT